MNVSPGTRFVVRGRTHAERGRAGAARLLLALGVLCATTSVAAGEPLKTYISPPYFLESEKSGALPPVAARLPAVPEVARLGPGQTIGRYGGRMRILIGRERDTRLMVVYGYCRLVGYDLQYNLVPDILQSFDVKDGRIFTLHLRKGHRWSDGAPFTSEDFRYYWEDVAQNKELSPGGPPKALLVGGKPPRFEVLDETTVRYTWDKPNPQFLTALAGAAPLFIYRPAHYLKRFHIKYANPAALQREATARGLYNWAALHNLKDNLYRFDNPDLPTLQPWRATTFGPSQRFVFVRNPFYHRVDPEGRQLPYLDRVILRISSPGLIAAKTSGGESDLQARGLEFNQYTFLKLGAKRAHYRVNLWKTSQGAHLALFPNLNVTDPQWRRLFRDARFRRALSLGINRHEINQVMYYGLGTEGNNSVLPDSPLYERDLRFRWAEFDPKKANRILDGLGLTRRDAAGLRLLPNGRPMEIIVESSGEHTEQTDALELVHDSWLQLGIKLYSKPSQREVLRKRILAGETMMAIWGGLPEGIASADMSPAELAPTNPYQFQWPRWGEWFYSRGRQGEAPDLPAAKELVALYRDWELAPDHAGRRAVWRKMLEVNADQVFSFGLIGAIPHPVVVSDSLRNVPVQGRYSWNPGAYFGVYHPDTFWRATVED